MKPPCLGSHFAVIEASAFLLAIVFNAILAFLIANKTTAELRTYSRVLLCSCIVDTAFSAASFLVQVHGDMRHGMLVIVVDGLLVGDLQRNLALLGGYMLALYSTILYAAVPMAFRYMVLGANALPFIVVGAVFSSAYTVIVCCAYKVSRKVKSVKTWSVSARDAQNQIHTALLFQASTPLLLDVVPLGFGEAAIFGGCEFCQYMFPFVTTFLAWIPAVNALSTMLFIKCYRKALRNLISLTVNESHLTVVWLNKRRMPQYTESK